MQQEKTALKKSLLISIILFLILISAVGVWAFLHQQDRLLGTDTEEKLPERQTQRSPVEKQDVSIRSASEIDYSDFDLVYSGDTPVYVSIYSHNEDSWESLVNTERKYLDYREHLIERAQVLASYDVEWNWQTDQPVVEAMAKYENDPVFRRKYDLTDDPDMNVLEYLSTLGVHFDPHAHTNNYADIAYVIENSLGVEATSVIGGLAFLTCGNEYLGFLDFMSWHEAVDLQADGYVYGKDYPEAKWKPEILSDPGMSGHYFDDYSTGVWKPGDEDMFYSHYPDSNIVYIGEGYPHDRIIIGNGHASGSQVFAQDGAYIKELVSKIESGELPTGLLSGERFMYTASVHIRDKDVVTDGGNEANTVDGIKAFMTELQPLRDSGKVIFVDFEEAAEIWKEEYNSVPYFANMEDFSFYDELESGAREHCEGQDRR